MMLIIGIYGIENPMKVPALFITSLKISIYSSWVDSCAGGETTIPDAQWKSPGAACSLVAIGLPLHRDQVDASGQVQT
jgi:hypothetical protein